MNDLVDLLGLPEGVYEMDEDDFLRGEYPLEEDEEFDPTQVPTQDTDEGILDNNDLEYPDFAHEDTFLISGPLVHGTALSESDEGRRQTTRAAARAFVRGKYPGRVVEHINSHPHRWIARVRKG